MKLAAMILMAVMVAKPGASAQGKSKEKRPVTVFFTHSPDVPFFLTAQGRGLASEMFASIAITLHWREGSPAPSDTSAISIEFVSHTPDTRLPGALGYALPLEGVHIGIFWDRINVGPSPRWLLAHVIVHEITHILEGVDRHADEGVMKAYWTARDQSAMLSKPLRFTPADVELIYKGVDARAAHAPGRLAAQTPTAAALEFAAR